MRVEKYTDEREMEWDDFVLNKTCNGTFLQTRRFINYHPAGKFEDASCMIYDPKNRLVAVCLGCKREGESGSEMISHAGTTYGGVLVDRGFYQVGKVIEIIQCLETFWREQKFSKAVLRQTPSLFAREKVDLIKYAYYYLGWVSYDELNLYVDLDRQGEDVLATFAQGKRTNVHNCIKRGLTCRKLTEYGQIEQLIELLAITLRKYDKEPIHTPQEIYEFIKIRLKEECECFGIYDADKMIAASMMFYFNNVGVAHTQYLCADPEYSKLSPMTFMYYSMMMMAKERGFHKISWGICTEELGKYLNEGLAKSKEGFGSRHEINYTFEKNL